MSKSDFEILLEETFPVTTLLEKLETLRLEGWRLSKGQYVGVFYCDAVTARVYAMKANSVADAVEAGVGQHSKRGETFIENSPTFILSSCTQPFCPCGGEITMFVVVEEFDIWGPYHGEINSVLINE